MTTLVQRDEAELAQGIANWCAHRRPEATHTVVELARPNSGWSNETLLVTVAATEGTVETREPFVVRLPPLLATWPEYDLESQAQLLQALAAAPIPVPSVIAFEHDEQWLGAPFLVMTREPGRAGAEMPALDPATTDATPAQQRAMHEAFVGMLAAIHRVDWKTLGLDRFVRGGEGAIANEIGWWRHYVDWAADGEPTPALAAAIEWCAQTAPEAEPAASLCWGDARIGNMLFTDARNITTVLDWELATIGPAESDLAWYLALDELGTFFIKRTVEGFLDRDALIAFYERALGRAVRDLEWHEIFALTRSVAINERQARLAATTGIPYPGVAGEKNPALRYLTRKIEAYPG